MRDKRFPDPFLVQHLLERSSARLPDKVALVFGEERLSYSAINEKANRLAFALGEMGIRRQDRVAIFLENSIEAVISIFGILKADAIFLILSPALRPQKLAYILNNCQVKALLTHSSKSNVVLEALTTAKDVNHVLWAGSMPELNTDHLREISHHEFGRILSQALSSMALINASAVAQHPTPNTQHPFYSQNIDMDLASIIYTSGSTGIPKGVMLTHRNIIAAVHSIISYIENREDDVILNALPLSFDYGLYQIFMSFCFGGTIVLERGFSYPYDIARKMAEDRVTGFPGVPTMFALFLRLDRLDRVDLSNLRYITSTGEVFPKLQIRLLRQRFPEVRIYSMYGLTECKRVTYLSPEEIDRRPESVGKGMPNEEVWIVDDKGSPVGPEVVGELVVRGANVMRGYWDLPEDTKRALRPGKYPGETVLYTGDLFKMDKEGFLHFVGRKDDMFKSRGKMVSPREIERCLCSLEGISGAAVIGMPDEIIGNTVVAFICLEKQGISEEDIIRHCQANLEDHLVPQVLRIVPSLPVTITGKTDKSTLKRIAK